MAEQTEREKLIAQKISQGLLREQAEEVVTHQEAEDKAQAEKAEKAKKSK